MILDTVIIVHSTCTQTEIKKAKIEPKVLLNNSLQWVKLGFPPAPPH